MNWNFQSSTSREWDNSDKGGTLAWPATAETRQSGRSSKGKSINNGYSEQYGTQDYNAERDYAVVRYQERQVVPFRDPQQAEEDRKLRPGVVSTAVTYDERGNKIICYEPISFGDPEYYEHFFRKYIEPFAGCRLDIPEYDQRSSKRNQVSDLNESSEEEPYFGQIQERARPPRRIEYHSSDSRDEHYKDREYDHHYERSYDDQKERKKSKRRRHRYSDCDY